jgi:SAM-dependent methyltransferase
VSARQASDDRADRAELERIRRVFERRDERGLDDGRGARGRAARRLADERLEATRRLLRATFPDDPFPRYLDVGCGTGRDLGWFLGAGWLADRLAGIDAVATRVRLAAAAAPGVDVRLAHALSLPYADGSFDVTAAVLVFSSIGREETRRALFAEMWRVTAPAGLVVVYDLVVRNPRNPDVVAMPLAALTRVGGRPTGSTRLSPFLPAVAVAEAIDPRLARLVMRVAPRTHRLTWWRRD